MSMNPTELYRPASANSVNAASGADESRVFEAVEEYLAALEAGQAPSREEFLSGHPAIAAQLGRYLDGLELIHRAGSAAGPVSDGDDAANDLAGAEPLGDFLLLRELGRGGMGVVYEALQRSLNRRVALKVLPFAAALDPKQLQRFQNEAQAAALLHHPHIVPVFSVGCERGVHYYAMQYIDGQTLAAVLAELRQQAKKEDGGWRIQDRGSQGEAEGGTLHDRGPHADTKPNSPLSSILHPPSSFFRNMVNAALQAAEALAHAHEEGVVHRDIKPANLLVDIKGKVWITDFGLARCQSQAGLTMTGDLVGTLRYMSPEQALAKRVLVDHRTDIYSLGVTLYELLTLEPAYRGQDRQELLRQIAFEEPRPLRRLNKAIPTELETIVQKATEKNPTERYATAQELADDLRRFLEDKPIRAKPPTLVQRARKWSRRHRAVVAATAVVLAMALVLLGGTGGWLVQRRLAAENEALNAIVEAEIWEQQARWPEARAAARRAEGLLTGGGGRGELQQRVRELLDDLAMVERLEKIRLDQSQVADNHFDLAAADSAYAQAFRDYGADVEALGLEAVAWIRTRSIAVELAAALDNWAMARRQGRGKVDGTWKRLLALARAADADALRTRVRQALETEDQTAVQVVAREAESHLSATTLDLVGRALQDRGASTPALALLREGQRRYPGDFWLNHDLAYVLMQGKSPQLHEAIRFYTAAVALRPQSPGVYVNLGGALDHQGRRDEAAAAYCKAIELKPDYVEAYCNLGNVLCKQNRLDEAVATHRKAIEIKPDAAAAYSNLGSILWRRGQLDEAVTAFRKAIELKPEDAVAHTNLSVALKDQGHLDEASAAARKAVELKPDFTQAHINLSSVLRARGHLDEAMASDRKAIELEPDSAVAYVGFGLTLGQQGRSEEAVAAYRKAIELKPDYAEAYNNLSGALKEKGQLGEAVAVCRKAIELKPDDAVAHSNLSNVLRAQGQLDGALAAGRKAIELKPNLAAAHYNVGAALQSQGRLDEALTACRKAIELKPDYAEAHCNLGAVLTSQGRRDEAVAAYRKAVELKPDLAVAHYNLGTVLTAQGRWDEAEAAYRKAIEVKPDYADAHYNLGNILKAQGRRDEAVAAYCKAIEKADLAEAHCNLASILQKEGKFEQALVHYRRGHDLGSRQSGWSYPSARWLLRCERLLELDRKLPSILKGEVQPADAAERLDVAILCGQTKQRYAAAAQFFEEAFAAQPAMANDLQSHHRYNAACAAALAGCGQGEDARQLDSQARARLRRQALDWLKADLADWCNGFDKAPDTIRPAIVQTMQHWLTDTDVAEMRSPDGLARLPEAERQVWQGFWDEVQRLLDRAKATPPIAPQKKS
jgi:tetratricopeptide (TPR) repeat protein